MQYKSCLTWIVLLVTENNGERNSLLNQPLGQSMTKANRLKLLKALIYALQVAYSFFLM